MFLLPFYCPTRFSVNNKTNWSDFGYALYFSAQDLEASKALSANKDDPWEHSREAMLAVARSFKQVFVFQWTPESFGATLDDDPNLHTTIVQRVFPTRTGLNGMKSTVVVWMSAMNGGELMRPRQFYKKSDIGFPNFQTNNSYFNFTDEL